MSVTTLIQKVCFMLGCALAFSSCASISGISNEVNVGANAEEVLSKYGAPEKVQKVLTYEVWSYYVEGSQQCQLFFQKKTLSQPVKCFDLPTNHVIALRRNRE